MNLSPAFSSSMQSRTHTISRNSSLASELYSMRVSIPMPCRTPVTVKPDVPSWMMVPVSVVSVVVTFCIYSFLLQHLQVHNRLAGGMAWQWHKSQSCLLVFSGNAFHCDALCLCHKIEKRLIHIAHGSA